MKIQFKASIQAWKVVGLILLVCGLQLYCPQTAAGATIITFDAPCGSTDVPCAVPFQVQGTVPTAISSTRAIAGYYLDANFVYHGFLRDPGGTFTVFDAPGAGTGQFQGTQAFSINPAGAITGYYIDTGGTTHCFLRAPNGTVTNIDPPGSIGSTEFAPSGTAPIAINPTGYITGNYLDANFGLHGFLRAPGGGPPTTFDPPGSSGPQTYPMAINPAGAITGSYLDVNTGTFQGFLRAPDGTFPKFDPQGSLLSPTSLLTQVTAINPAGAITGWYFPNFFTGPVHGFLRSPNGNIISFDPPAPLPALGIFPYAINPAGTITGNYFGNNQYHGFLRATGGAFTTFDPQGSTNTTTPTAINQSGEVTGWYYDASFIVRGFLRVP